MRGLVDFARIEEMATRIKGRIDLLRLPRVTPFAAPLFLEAGRIRPIVGREADVADLPQELERMERRETMGRTIIRW